MANNSRKGQDTGNIYNQPSDYQRKSNLANENGSLDDQNQENNSTKLRDQNQDALEEE